MICAEEVSFAYDGRRVVDGVSLTTVPGGVLGLIGPNGSGKTTLLRMLHGALAPQSGRVTLDGTTIAELGHREVARRLAVVVQESVGELPITVAEMVLLGRAPHLPGFRRPGAHDHQLAAAALRRVGARHLADRYVTGLSGGERQRVLIARALAQDAPHLLLDEPTNHLDVRYQHEVLALVRSLSVTTVVVLHDLNLAARYCDRLFLLDAGRLVAAGTPEEVLRPDVVEPVYRIGVTRADLDDGVQLLFRPLPSSETVAPTAPRPQEAPVP